MIFEQLGSWIVSFVLFWIASNVLGNSQSLNTLHRSWWGSSCYGAAILAAPNLFISLERIDRLFDLRPQIGAVECCLVHHIFASRAVPAQPIKTRLWALLLNHHADLMPHIRQQPPSLSLWQ